MKNKKEKKNNFDVIKESKDIRELLQKKISESRKELSEIEKAGKKVALSSANLSRYLNDDQSGRSKLTQRQILWLCRYFCIKIILQVKPVKCDEQPV